ncbi:SMC-Scp complex subunit ScpB [Candidatus Hecatella orcuttiae]|uniref:SMC-Scp complex subunit ScpB n=1 Tax=Candidatus Hecatella orcuttiae TaxID=1935119 RepID=UPI002867BA5C|nr:SMC-Scp complex subunit ScpB [Candidatus Hecatella orcuttiae]
MTESSQLKELDKHPEKLLLEPTGEAEELQAKKRLIEAALYVAGYPLELKTLCSVAQIYSKRKVQELARSLAEEYKARNGCLEILELEDGRFVMQLKTEYVPRVRRLSIKPLLTEGPLRTLSYIAYKQPVPQAKVIDVRGPQAYEHIHRLQEMGLIGREKFGKSHLLRTTSVFSDYFGLSKELKLMKKQLEAMFTQAEKEATKRREEKTPASQG